MNTTYDCRAALRVEPVAPVGELSDAVLLHEATICHMLARVLRVRCAIVRVGASAATIDWRDVEPGMAVLYATI